MLRSLLPKTPDRNLFSGAMCSTVNVVLVEPSCTVFRCSVETFGTDIADAVVVMGEESNLMYVSETNVTEDCRSATWAIYSENQDGGVRVTTLLKR